MRVENIVLDGQCNVTLTAYIADIERDHNIDRRPAVIVFPGGGYKFCSDQEGEPVALNFCAAGYHAFVLRYSVNDKFTDGKPLADYEKAYEYILSRADDWRIMTDKIAVMGFSAGGHLAACAATMSRYRPAAAILGYAVTLRETVDAHEMGTLEPCAHITPDTCPTFLFATANDVIVPIANTLEYASALNRCGVPFECHIYSQGEHGFSLGTQGLIRYGNKLCERAGNWFADCASWLKETLGGSLN